MKQEKHDGQVINITKVYRLPIETRIFIVLGILGAMYAMFHYYFELPRYRSTVFQQVAGKRLECFVDIENQFRRKWALQCQKEAGGVALADCPLSPDAEKTLFDYRKTLQSNCFDLYPQPPTW